MKPDLPSGRRKMDLLWQRGRVFAFGQPASRRGGAWHTLAKISVIVAGLSALLSWGYTAWPVQLMIVLAVLTGAILTFANWESRRGTLMSGNIVIDAAKGTMEVPAGTLEGTHRLEDFAFVLESEHGPDAINERSWWVALTTTMDAERDRSFSFTIRLYGPGNKGEMEMARLELERKLNDRE